MEIVRLVLLLLHLMGFAALLGGLLVQAREPVKRVNAPMRDGSGTAVVAGILLVAVIQMGDFPTADSFNAKVGVKLLVGVVILALVMMNLRKERISQALWATLLGLTVLNVAVALFWAPAHGAY